MLVELENYDWEEAFGEGSGGNCDKDTEAYGDVSTEPPMREDVVEILAQEDGENDGEQWIGVFRLRDGRIATVEAGCDYTGWD